MDQHTYSKVFPSEPLSIIPYNPGSYSDPKPVRPKLQKKIKEVTIEKPKKRKDLSGIKIEIDNKYEEKKEESSSLSVNDEREETPEVTKVEDKETPEVTKVEDKETPEVTKVEDKETPEVTKVVPDLKQPADRTVLDKFYYLWRSPDQIEALKIEAKINNGEPLEEPDKKGKKKKEKIIREETDIGKEIIDYFNGSKWAEIDFLKDKENFECVPTLNGGAKNMLIEINEKIETKDHRKLLSSLKNFERKKAGNSSKVGIEFCCLFKLPNKDVYYLLVSWTNECRSPGPVVQKLTEGKNFKLFKDTSVRDWLNESMDKVIEECGCKWHPFYFSSFVNILLYSCSAELIFLHSTMGKRHNFRNIYNRVENAGNFTRARNLAGHDEKLLKIFKETDTVTYGGIKKKIHEWYTKEGDGFYWYIKKQIQRVEQAGNEEGTEVVPDEVDSEICRCIHIIVSHEEEMGKTTAAETMVKQETEHPYGLGFMTLHFTGGTENSMDHAFIKAIEKYRATHGRDPPGVVTDFARASISDNKMGKILSFLERKKGTSFGTDKFGSSELKISSNLIVVVMTNRVIEPNGISMSKDRFIYHFLDFNHSNPGNRWDVERIVINMRKLRDDMDAWGAAKRLLNRREEVFREMEDNKTFWASEILQKNRFLKNYKELKEKNPSKFIEDLESISDILGDVLNEDSSINETLLTNKIKFFNRLFKEGRERFDQAYKAHLTGDPEATKIVKSYEKKFDSIRKSIEQQKGGGEEGRKKKVLVKDFLERRYTEEDNRTIKEIVSEILAGTFTIENEIDYKVANKYLSSRALQRRKNPKYAKLIEDAKKKEKREAEMTTLKKESREFIEEVNKNK